MAFYYQVAGFLLILHSCISKCQGFSGYVAQRKQREVQREGCESKKQMAVSGSFRVVSLNLAHGEMVVMTLYVILPWLIDPNNSPVGYRCQLLPITGKCCIPATFLLRRVSA